MPFARQLTSEPAVQSLAALPLGPGRSALAARRETRGARIPVPPPEPEPAPAHPPARLPHHHHLHLLLRAAVGSVARAPRLPCRYSYRHSLKNVGKGADVAT